MLTSAGDACADTACAGAIATPAIPAKEVATVNSRVTQSRMQCNASRSDLGTGTHCLSVPLSLPLPVPLPLPLALALSISLYFCRSGILANLLATANRFRELAKQL